MSQFAIQLPGLSKKAVGVDELARMALARQLPPETLVIEEGTGLTVTAKQVPGVFSTRQWWVATLLSAALGYLGLDRFYVGNYALGVLKLITAGGFGIWYLIDVVLFATRRINDNSGLPLA